MGKFATQFLIEIASVIGGGIGGALNMINNLIKSGFKSATQFHQEGVAFARELGLNAKEAQAYTEVLTRRTEQLAIKYGVTAEQVKELQKNISIATSRQLMLNDSQAEQFLQLNKLVGSNTVSKFTEELMNGMGGQLDTVTGAVSKAYATAAKSGLNAQKVSEKIANNLNMANKLSFRTGIDGLTRMAMQAEKVGMSLQSVEAVANNFLEIDDAIEHSARLQMLGGAAGALGGNPLDIAYEANNDPEALQKRMIKMLGGYASFDSKTGMSNINGVNMDFVRNIAKAMGISTEEATRISKKNAEIKFKENKFGGRFANYSKEQQDFIMNKSYVRDGRLYMSVNGKESDITSGSLNKDILDEMMKYQGMSDRDIMEENAKSLTSINEQLKGIADSIAALFAKFLNGLFPNLVKDTKDLGGFFKNELEPAARNVGVAVREIVDWFKGHKDVFKTVGGLIVDFIKFSTEHWKLVLGAILGFKTLKFFGGIPMGGGAKTLGGAAASGIGRGISSIGRGIKNIGTSRGFWDVALGRQHKNAAGKWVNSKGRFISKGLARTSVAAKIGGAALGVGLGAYNAITADNTADRGAGIGTAVGTALGAVIGGPVGAAIGGFLGDFGGRFIGEHWGEISTTITDAWEGIKNWFGEAWNGWLGTVVDIFFPFVGVVRHLDEITSWFGNTWRKIGNLWDSFTTKLGNAISKFWDFATNPIKYIKSATGDIIGGATSWVKEKSGFSTGGVVGGNSYSGDKVLARLNSGEAVVTPKQFNALFNMAEAIIKPKPVGEKEYIYTPNSSSTSNVNGNTITVKDFNINLSGTLRLDGGNSQKNIDINELLRDHEFVTALKNIIKTSINQDINGGRFMNDLATVGGFPAQTSIYAKQ